MTRTVLKITGSDAQTFLQDLVTNDVTRAQGGPVYAALLTPQGKYLADFFVLAQDDALLVDVAHSHAAPLAQRLSMYKLRADVQIGETDIAVTRGTGIPPPGAHADPRHPALGWRSYGAGDGEAVDWDALRVAHLIPKTGVELGPDTFILEAGFGRLNGVDFRKGCYVGQEVTARMKHKTVLRKGLARVVVSGPAEPGAQIMTDGKPVGVLHTRSGDAAIAYLRFDRAQGEMSAGNATVRMVAEPI